MISEAARPSPAPLGDYENRSILDAARNLPPPRASDIIVLAPIPDFCLRCPNCQFLDDRIRPECHVCGIVFAKWSKRSAPVQEEPEGFWSWVEAILDLVLGHPRKTAVFAAAMAVLWVADGPRRLHGAVAPIAPGEWKAAGPLSYRVGYLKPEGFLGSLPIYHEGDSVGYLLEVKNLGPGPISGLRIKSVQEVPSSASRPGKILSEARLFGAPQLRVGETVQFSGRFTVAGFNTTGSHSEFTHLTFDQKGPAGEIFTFADIPKAGVIDP